MKKLVWVAIGVLVCFALIVIFTGLAASDGCKSVGDGESSSESGGNNGGNGNDLEKLPFGDSDSPIELPILPYD